MNKLPNWSDRFDIMESWRNNDIEYFLSEFKGHDIRDYDVQYQDISFYKHVEDQWENYSWARYDNNKVEDIVRYLVSLQNDFGGVFRYEIEIISPYDESVGWLWFEVNNYNFDYDWDDYRKNVVK